MHTQRFDSEPFETRPGDQSYGLATRTDAARAQASADVNLDWTVEYPSSGLIPGADTTAALGRALARVGDELIGAIGEGGIDVVAKCHLHLGIALGHVFRRPTGIVPQVLVEGEWWRCDTVDIDDSESLNTAVLHGPADTDRASVEVSIAQERRPWSRPHHRCRRNDLSNENNPSAFRRHGTGGTNQRSFGEWMVGADRRGDSPCEQTARRHRRRPLHRGTTSARGSAGDGGSTPSVGSTSTTGSVTRGPTKLIWSLPPS